MKGLNITDKIIADIDICKEILSTMPKNNEKNKKKRSKNRRSFLPNNQIISIGHFIVAHLVRAKIVLLTNYLNRDTIWNTHNLLERKF